MRLAHGSTVIYAILLNRILATDLLDSNCLTEDIKSDICVLEPKVHSSGLNMIFFCVTVKAVHLHNKLFELSYFLLGVHDVLEQRVVSDIEVHNIISGIN